MNDLINLLFLLQLEEYDTKRFLTLVKTLGNSQIKQEKKHLVWTTKAHVIYFLAQLLTVLGVKPLKAIIIATKMPTLGEDVLKHLIIFMAKLKLHLYPDLIVIGIAGSYAKTSVKEILCHILETQYTVLKTPESYNTPLGIAKIILTKLSSLHQIFIVEMGAYQIGDIKNLCNFVRPKIGILTNIGKQHLERFGSVENIIKAKSELLLSLPTNGLAITNADNIYCLEVANKLKIKTILYSINPNVNLEFRTSNFEFLTAFNLKSDQFASSFQIKTNGGVRQFKTQLLGVHNIANILAAIAVAHNLNISWNNISQTVSTLLPIPHRLQLIPSANNTTVIDDTYNANHDSVKAALVVLKSFDSPRKIVITPGIIELGKEQNKENEMMGKEIAKVADYLLIVGKTNRESIRKGFISYYDTAQYHSKVIACEDLNEATKKLQEIIIPQSVILFENDLPDQYL